jgi:hypothetical protein
MPYQEMRTPRHSQLQVYQESGIQLPSSRRPEVGVLRHRCAMLAIMDSVIEKASLSASEPESGCTQNRRRSKEPLFMPVTKPPLKSPSPSPILTIPELEHAKAAALGTLVSLHSRRAYNNAIDKFIAWYCSEPRLGFNRVVVLRYRSFLESLSLSAALDSSMPSGSALTISRRMIFVVHAPACVLAQEVNSNKFSFFSVTRPCKRRNDTSDAGRSSKKQSMIAFESHSQTRHDNPVYRMEIGANKAFGYSGW